MSFAKHIILFMSMLFICKATRVSKVSTDTSLERFLDRLYQNCTYNVDRLCLYDTKVEGSYKDCISFKMVECFVNANPPPAHHGRDVFRLACIDVMEKICFNQVLYQDDSANSYYYCIRQFVESCNIEPPVLCNNTQYQKMYKGCLDFCKKTAHETDDDYVVSDNQNCISSCNEPCKPN